MSPNSARTTNILSVFSRESSTYWLLAALADLPPFFSVAFGAASALPRLTTVLAPRRSAFFVPLTRSCSASERSARRLSSNAFGSSSGAALVAAAACCGAAPLLVTAEAVTEGPVARPTSTARLTAPTPVLRAVMRMWCPFPDGMPTALREQPAAMTVRSPDPGADLSNICRHLPVFKESAAKVYARHTLSMPVTDLRVRCVWDRLGAPTVAAGQQPEGHRRRRSAHGGP